MYQPVYPRPRLGAGPATEPRPPCGCAWPATQPPAFNTPPSPFPCCKPNPRSWGLRSTITPNITSHSIAWRRLTTTTKTRPRAMTSPTAKATSTACSQIGAMRASSLTARLLARLALVCSTPATSNRSRRSRAAARKRQTGGERLGC